MKNTKPNIKHLAFGLLVTVLLSFTACQNPIIETWWQERGMDMPFLEEGYHTIIKRLPPQIKYIFVEVMNTIQAPGEVIIQSLDIIEIQYIIFAGNQTEYNNRQPAPPGTSWLTDAQFNTNRAYIASMVQTLRDNPDFFVVIHGHANPTLQPGQPGYELDLADCERIAQERADSVAQEFESWGINASRIKTNGFASNRPIADPTHPELNRRVEVIIVNITSIEVTP